MADLRGLFGRLGFGEVRTLLNSGNVVFSAPQESSASLGSRIQQALTSELGIVVPVILLPGREIAVAVREDPFATVANDLSRYLVVVLHTPADRRRLTPLLTSRWGSERFAIGRRVAYLWCADGIADSELWPKVDRALERRGTARNMRTMMKLLALVEDGT